MLYRILMLCAIGALVVFKSVGAADSQVCPDSISVRQQLTEVVPGWTTFLDDTPHRLAGITFYDGPTEDKASLVNDQTAKAADRETATWHFMRQGGQQIWMACSYSGTAIVLKRALAATTSTCSVTYNPKIHIAGLPTIEKIACK